MQIRIISTPPGEAPEEVRNAWFGLVLPVPDKYANSESFPTTGVLSGPKGFFGTLAAIFRGQIKMESGYVVAADKAVEILGQHAPNAAAWWRQNAAGRIAPGKHFMFSRNACEVVREGGVAQPSDPSLIVPRIKHTNFLAAIRERIKNEDDMPATEPLAADLLVTYAFDLPEAFQMARVRDVRQLGLSPCQLRATAVANLARQIGNPGRQGEPPLVQVVTGNNLEACVLLLDDFWRVLADKIPPEIIAGVPTRDVLLVTTTAAPGGLQQLRERVKEARTGDNTHWLTGHVLVRRSGKWEVFD